MEKTGEYNRESAGDTAEDRAVSDSDRGSTIRELKFLQRKGRISAFAKGARRPN